MSTDLKSKYAGVLLRPRITEKATDLSGSNVYVFEIGANTNKLLVNKAVSAYFGVVPSKVRIVKNPAKKVMLKGKVGRKPSIKKAYVYLKQGDSINLA